MARSPLLKPTKDIIVDNGTVLASLVVGEQRALEITLEWLTSMAGFTVKATVVEGLNVDGEIPESEAVTPAITQLTILDDNVNDNAFKIVLPKTLGIDWDVKPTPSKPVYGFLEVSVSDSGTGVNQTILKPIRGLIRLDYSPTEA